MLEGADWWMQPSLNERWSAASALGKIGDARAVEPLIKALKTNGDVMRDVVAAALSIIGEPVVEPLINALGGKDWSTRLGAADALGRIGDERAVEPLINRLNDRSKYVRAGAARALGKIGDSRAVEPLRRLLDGDNNKVRNAAAHALEDIERVKYGSY